jgi:flagellar motor switch protein FliN/FliY
MADDNLMNQSEIEKLLAQGPAAAASAATATSPDPPPAQPAPADPSAGDPSKLLAQNDIEDLLNQAGKTPFASQTRSPLDTPSQAPPAEAGIAEKDIEYLLNRAEQALESINSSHGEDLPNGIHAFRFEELSGAPASTDTATLDLIRDVELDLKIELGRTQMYLEDVLKLRRGSVVPLDKLAGDPVDIYVNGRLVARGEVLVMNDNFCVRVAELIAGGSVCA